MDLGIFHCHRLGIVRGVTTEEEVEHCVRVSQRMGVTVSRAVTPFGPDTRVALANRYGMQVMELTPVTFTQAQQHIKRAFDAVVASLTLLLLWPLFLLCVMLVKFSSPGPVLYRSRRVGRGGRHFTFLKFRTMYQGSSRASVAASNEKSGHIFKVKNDPRVTPVGRFLRRFSLDELPQIVNVLLGEMSLVGPRPLPAGDLDPDGMSRQFSFWAEQRSRVAPGITGLWQIRGRSAVPFEKMMEFDVEYIRGWSVLADLKILFETPIVVITGLGAY